MILRRSGISWTSEESSDVSQGVERSGTCVVMLDGVRF